MWLMIFKIKMGTGSGPVRRLAWMPDQARYDGWLWSKYSRLEPREWLCLSSVWRVALPHHAVILQLDWGIYFKVGLLAYEVQNGYRIESGKTGCVVTGSSPVWRVAFIERFPIRSSGMTFFWVRYDGRVFWMPDHARYESGFHWKIPD